MANLWAGRRSEKVLRREFRQRRAEVQSDIALALGRPLNSEEPQVRADSGARTTRTERRNVTTLNATSYDDVVVPEDTYTVQLLEFSEPRDGDYGRYTFMRVKILNGEYADSEISTALSLKMSPKAKLRGCVEAFLGRPLEAGEPVDLEGLAARGPKARALMETKVREDGGEVSKIAKLLKLPPKAGPVAAKAAAVVVAEDEPF